MKIGKTVSDSIVSAQKQRNKYSHIYAAVEQLKNGDWLTVECDDREEARRIAMAAYHNKNNQVQIRGLTVLIRKKEETNGHRSR